MPAGAAIPAEPIATPAELAAVVDRMAGDVDRSHAGGLVVVALLKGSLCFTADLVRRLQVPVTVDFLGVSPFASGSPRVRLVKDLDTDIGGRPVLLVTDIVDTGLTLAYLRTELAVRGPASLALATLVDKPVRRLVPLELDHVGLTVGDVHVLGYGLGYAGRYRNLPGLWAADAGALAAEPDRHLLQLYGG